MAKEAHRTLKMLVEEQRKLDYPNMRPDDYFEIFTASQILKHARFNPDSNEIEAGIVGGGGDGGVDGFYVYCNKKLIREDTDISLFMGQRTEIEIIVIQAKNKPSFEESVPMKFKDFVENCLSTEDYSADCKILYSEELLEAASRFHRLFRACITGRPSLSITFYHATQSDDVNEKVIRRGEIACSVFKTAYNSAKCRYVPVTGTELVAMSYEQEETNLSLPVVNYFDVRSFNRDAYVCVVRLGNFYNFITDKNELRESIFEANVRDHQPDATVNKGIQESLMKSNNDDFWWLNNGITIIASEATYGSGQIHITDPRIVNGLQTSHEIYEHIKNGGSLDDGRSIMVRVIANKDDETSDRIIHATNSQTKINSIYLHSTEQIHRNIEVALRAIGLYYDRRKNYYRNRGISISQIVTMYYLTQAVAAIVLQQPDNARMRPGTVTQKSYKLLYSEEYPIDLYSKCVQILKRSYQFLQNRGLGKTDTLNLVFYLAMYVTCYACNSPKPKRNTIASLDVAAINEAKFQKCFEWIDTEFKRLGGDDRVAKGTQLTASLVTQVITQFGRKKK